MIINVLVKKTIMYYVDIQQFNFTPKLKLINWIWDYFFNLGFINKFSKYINFEFRDCIHAKQPF